LIIVTAPCIKRAFRHNEFSCHPHVWQRLDDGEVCEVKMDWALQGVRLLGLAALGLWEYFVFKQRYSTRTGKLRAKQIDGTAAIMTAINAIYIPLMAARTNDTGETQQILQRYTDAVGVYRQWVALLPSEVNEAIAHVLTLCEQLIAARGTATEAEQRRSLQQAYLRLVEQLRATLGVGALGTETQTVLEQGPAVRGSG
jgi:hypothetical protein